VEQLEAAKLVIPYLMEFLSLADKWYNYLPWLRHRKKAAVQWTETAITLWCIHRI